MNFKGTWTNATYLVVVRFDHIIVISIDVVIHLHISFPLLMLWLLLLLRLFYSLTLVLRLLFLCPRMSFFLQVRSPFCHELERHISSLKFPCMSLMFFFRIATYVMFMWSVAKNCCCSCSELHLEAHMSSS